MTAASLEALARALARLEPSVFGFYGGDGLHWFLECIPIDDFAKPVMSLVIGIDDDRLFGAVWRCAVARGYALEMHVNAESSYANVKKPFFNREARATTPGVALALAYCAAYGDIVGEL